MNNVCDHNVNVVFNTTTKGHFSRPGVVMSGFKVWRLCLINRIRTPANMLFILVKQSQLVVFMTIFIMFLSHLRLKANPERRPWALCGTGGNLLKDTLATAACPFFHFSFFHGESAMLNHWSNPLINSKLL